MRRWPAQRVVITVPTCDTGKILRVFYQDIPHLAGTSKKTVSAARCRPRLASLLPWSPCEPPSCNYIGPPDIGPFCMQVVPVVHGVDRDILNATQEGLHALTATSSHHFCNCNAKCRAALMLAAKKMPHSDAPLALPSGLSSLSPPVILVRSPPSVSAAYGPARFA